MFESLGERLQDVFKTLRGETRLTEENVESALREIRLALLEADVNFKVVKAFIDRVRDRAMGQDVLRSLSPSQQVLKIVRDEMVALFGDGEGGLRSTNKRPRVVVLLGLQGAGKTTTAGKLGKWLSGNIAEWCTIALMVTFVSVAGTTPLSLAGPYVFGLVVLVFAFETGTASAILRLRPLVFLGAVSYSIYMTHFFIVRRLFDAGRVLDKLWDIKSLTNLKIDGREVHAFGTQLWHGDLAFPVFLAIVIAVSYFTYRWIEKPGRDWVRDRVKVENRTATSQLVSA